uniref:ATP-binding protein n=1 Tax=Parabacteroides gordonii TaxID=574930 RepID=UPI0026E954D8
MNTLTFHITDIASNSVRAGATRIMLDVVIEGDNACIRIADNGCGMDAETVSRVSNPFYTTRTTRRIGLGIPFLIQNAEQTGG